MLTLSSFNKYPNTFELESASLLTLKFVLTLITCPITLVDSLSSLTSNIEFVSIFVVALISSALAILFDIQTPLVITDAVNINCKILILFMISPFLSSMRPNTIILLLLTKCTTSNHFINLFYQLLFYTTFLTFM